MTESISPFRTLRAGRVDRDEASLRIVAAVVCALGAGLYALSHPGVFSIIVSVTVIAAGVAWGRRANRSAARATLETLLVLAPTGVTIESAPEIAWPDVTGVEVDEDRLVVLVHRSTGDAVVIEPVFDGISVYDLAAMVERCRSFGQSPDA